MEGPYVVLERSDPVRSCRMILELLKDYRVEVNGKPADDTGRACNRGWRNNVSVYLRIPEKTVL